MGQSRLVTTLCRASYFISLLGLKIPCGLLVRASRAVHVLAFVTLVWVPFLIYTHLFLLPQVQDLSASTAEGIWHVLTAVWLTIPLLVVGAVILSFVNQRNTLVAFLSALGVMATFHGVIIPSIAQTSFGNILLHALFAFFEDMPVVGWIWCLVYVVRMQKHVKVKQAGRKSPFEECKDPVLIVGNAPTVTEGNPLGALIDDFSHVVRFNSYNTEKPEFTGSKVSFHFCNGRNFPTSNAVKAVCPLFNASLTHAAYLFMPHMEDAPEIFANLTSTKVEAWFVEEERILALCRRIGTPFWQIPTSGMVALDAFMGNSDQVCLHGFNFFQGKKIHYFQESPTQLITSWLERFVTHDPSREKKWVEGLAAKGDVSFLAQHPVGSETKGKFEACDDEATPEGKKKDDDADLRRRTPGLFRTMLKDGMPSQFSL